VNEFFVFDSPDPLFFLLSSSSSRFSPLSKARLHRPGDTFGDFTERTFDAYYK